MRKANVLSISKSKAASKGNMPKLAKPMKITLYGGFHNSKPINAIISASDYESLSKGCATLEEVLSPAQLEHMNRHFCGIEECCCGGVSRASWDRAN